MIKWHFHTVLICIWLFGIETKMSQKSGNRGLLIDSVDNIGYGTKRARYGIIKFYTFLSF
jgi:hypothetical protein